MKQITVYTQPGCQPCRAVKRWLSEREIPFAETDITQDPEALDFVTGELGYKQAPVVVMAQPVSHDSPVGYYSFSGFNPGELEKVAGSLLAAA